MSGPKVQSYERIDFSDWREEYLEWEFDTTITLEHVSPLDMRAGQSCLLLKPAVVDIIATKWGMPTERRCISMCASVAAMVVKFSFRRE
jgi:hypothetical protein